MYKIQFKTVGYRLLALILLLAALFMTSQWIKKIPSHMDLVDSYTIICGVVLALLAIYYFKQKATFLVLGISSFTTQAQDVALHQEYKKSFIVPTTLSMNPIRKPVFTIHNDSLELKKDSNWVSKPLIFKKEKGGLVCINGLEKLEAAGATDLSFLFATQIHFYAPGFLEGRLFGEVEEEKEGDRSVFFFNGTFGLTVGEFPMHISGNIKFDQLHHTVSSGPGLDMYWSDIPRFNIGNKSVDISNVFHIFRTSVSRLSVVKNIPTQYSNEDSSSLKKITEYSLFFQMQPMHLTHALSIFSEGSCRFNEDDNFFEFEAGLRHERLFDNLIGLGMRISAEDSHFHSVSGVLRFNISNPNPKHLSNKKIFKSSYLHSRSFYLL